MAKWNMMEEVQFAKTSTLTALTIQSVHNRYQIIAVAQLKLQILL